MTFHVMCNFPLTAKSRDSRENLAHEECMTTKTENSTLSTWTLLFLGSLTPPLNTIHLQRLLPLLGSWFYYLQSRWQIPASEEFTVSLLRFTSSKIPSPFPQNALNLRGNKRPPSLLLL
jgi:hypothetical protein